MICPKIPGNDELAPARRRRHCSIDFPQFRVTSSDSTNTVGKNDSPGQPKQPGRFAWLRELALPAGLLLLAFAAYGMALRGCFIWDDDSYVTNNPLMLSWSGLRSIWLEPWRDPQAYPLTFTTFWLEHALWGFRPAGYHLVNILLHCANAVLAWRVLLRIGATPAAAWLGAALFAVHPIEVESVAWICERKNVLSGFFYLAAALAWFRFEENRSWRCYGSALLLFVCALLAKSIACSLPVALLVLAWFRGRRTTWRAALAFLPFLAVGVVLARSTVWFERRIVSAIGHEYAFSVADRVLIAGRAFWFYPAKLLWPQPVTFIYPRWNIDPCAAWQWAFPIAAALAIAVLWLGRTRWGRAPIAAAAIYGASIFPALGFLNVYPMRYSFVADHFQYLAGLPLLALAGAGLARLPTSARRASACAILTAFIGLSAFQCGAYRSLETLWLDTLAKNPGAVIAWNNLSLLRFNQGRTEDSLHCIASALRLAPDDFEVRTNAGFLMARLGRGDAALAQYRAAIRLFPACYEAYNGCGAVLAGRGRMEEAAAEFRNAVRFQPDNARANGNLGCALLATGRAEEAIPYLRLAVRVAPGYREALAALVTALRKTGRLEEAIAVEKMARQAQQ